MTPSKTNYKFIDWSVIESVAKRMWYGAEKHKVTQKYGWYLHDKEEYKQALLRHVVAILKGELKDENGDLHTTAIICNAMILETLFKPPNHQYIYKSKNPRRLGYGQVEEPIELKDEGRWSSTEEHRIYWEYAFIYVLKPDSNYYVKLEMDNRKKLVEVITEGKTDEEIIAEVESVICDYEVKYLIEFERQENPGK